LLVSALLEKLAFLTFKTDSSWVLLQFCERMLSKRGGSFSPLFFFDPNFYVLGRDLNENVCSSEDLRIYAISLELAIESIAESILVSNFLNL